MAVAINAPPAPVAKSAWSPLAVPIFRALWVAYLISLIGTWAREAGGPKLMENLTTGQKDSPLWVSLVQTAGTLPICLLSIVAGVLADTLDRRKLLLYCNIWMLVVSAGLAAMTFGGAGVITRESLLLLTVLLGIGAAMAGPAFQYVIPELVPPGDLPLAVSLNSVALNIARAVGPALAGAVIALAGLRMGPIRATGTSFVLNAVAFIGVVWVLARWKRAPQKQPMHRESILDATLAAFRYTANSPALRAILIRVALFINCAVIVWAQLIIIAKRQLAAGNPAHGENLYYILMACVGAGAVVGVIFMPKMDKKFSTEGMVSICTAVFGVALIGMSQCTGRFANIYLAGALAMIIGFNWVIVPTNFNIATQRSVPVWVKGRAIAMYMTVLFGSFAVGSPIWGKVASVYGISRASLVAGSLIIAGLLLNKFFPLTRGMGKDHGPANRPALSDAPMSGTIEMIAEYRIDRARAAEFLRFMRTNIRRQRLRNGGIVWNLSHREDAASGGGTLVYEEAVTFANWNDRMRFHVRTTKADAAEEDELRAFLADSALPAVRHREVAPTAAVATPEATESRRMAYPPPVIDWDRMLNRALEEFDAIWDRIIREWYRDRR